MISVLYVDDEPLATKYFRMNYGSIYNVQTANSAAEAVELLKSKALPVDVVISDYLMPNRNGYEFLKEVKQLAPSVRRVLYTAYFSTESNCEVEGGDVLDRIIFKPASKKNITATLASLFLPDS